MGLVGAAKMLGILGGTFDPIHIAHLLSAETVRDALGLQKILFVPAGDPPHKRKTSKSPADHRRAMVALAIEPDPNFALCPVDLDRPGPHYSTDTVRLIREAYELGPNDCFFIIGGDSLADLPGWHQPDRLIQLCRLAVVHRPGYQPDIAALTREIPGLAGRLTWVEMPQLEISGSAIRARVRAGRSIRYQVPDRVWTYIRQHNLYR